MKILFITTEGFDTPGPNNQMATVMINDFLECGISVHLIQSRRKRINPDIPKILLGRKEFSYDIIQRKTVDKTKFFVRYIDEVKYAFQSMRKWIKIKGVDIVFLQSCPTVVFQMVLLRLFMRKPIVYNIYDVFPGHAFDIGVIKNRMLYNLLRILQKPCYSMSSIITVLSDDMKNILLAHNSKNKIRIVPPWYDESTVLEVKFENNRFISKYNISRDKFYVQFAGTIGYVLDYEAILFVASLLKSETNIIFQIIGEGNCKDQFVEEARIRDLTNIQFYPLQPLEIVPDVYSACSICIVPLKKGVIGNGVPSKAPLLMACRRVMVNSVEKESAYYRMFNENRIGISVPNDDYTELANAVLFLYRNPKTVEEMADKAMEFAKTHYSSSKNTRLYVDIFEEILESKKKH